MNQGRRGVWVDLRFAHPLADPTDPSDEFAQAVISAAGDDPSVWETGGTEEALTAYRVALSKITPSHIDALAALDDPVLALTVKAALRAGVGVDEFLTWTERSQDLAVAAVVREGDTCPSGRHPRAAMKDLDGWEFQREYCAACAAEHEHDQRDAQQPEHQRVGWTWSLVRKIRGLS